MPKRCAASAAIDVKLIDGVNHMGIVSAPAAVSAIADDVANGAEPDREHRKQEAAEALSRYRRDRRRVRQSTIYNLASLMMIMWGVLVFAGNIVTFLWPRYADYIWLAVYVAGIAGSFVFSAFDHPRTGIRRFDIRGCWWPCAVLRLRHFLRRVLGHFTPRQLGTFWPIYFMLFYTIVGLWFGYAFVVIGLGITALTLIGYFFVGESFQPWMAFVNGGGLILGGLWMRRS